LGVALGAATVDAVLFSVAILSNKFKC